MAQGKKLTSVGVLDEVVSPILDQMFHLTLDPLAVDLLLDDGQGVSCLLQHRQHLFLLHTFLI